MRRKPILPTVAHNHMYDSNITCNQITQCNHAQTMNVLTVRWNNSRDDSDDDDGVWHGCCWQVFHCRWSRADSCHWMLLRSCLPDKTLLTIEQQAPRQTAFTNTPPSLPSPTRSLPAPSLTRTWPIICLSSSSCNASRHHWFYIRSVVWGPRRHPSVIQLSAR